MAQQTAVEWLVKKLEINPGIRKWVTDAIKQAKQIEKEQIINARKNGFEQSHDRFHFQEWEGLDKQIDDKLNSEKYYNETYKK